MILNWTRTGPCNQESARDLVSEIKTPNIDIIYSLKQVLRSKTAFGIKMWRWRTNDHSTKCPVFIRSPSPVNKVKACDYLVRLWLWLRGPPRRDTAGRYDETECWGAGCCWLWWFTAGQTAASSPSTFSGGLSVQCRPSQFNRCSRLCR